MTESVATPLPRESEASVPPPEATPNRGSMRVRELVAVSLIVLAADFWIYRHQGYAGFAAFGLAAAGLLAIASPRRGRRTAQLLLAVMLAVSAAKLIWLGDSGQVAVGIGVLLAFALATAGRVPYLGDLFAIAVVALPSGLNALFWTVARRQESAKATRRPIGWAALLWPVAALLGFGTIFVLANPDVHRVVGERMQWFIEHLFDWLTVSLPDAGEIVFWGFMATAAAGLMRPLLPKAWDEVWSWPHPPAVQFTPPPATHEYAAARNTLVAVTALFAVYLAFEFATLWFREFPPGFYYAGYAHEGAAWLTVALVAACGVLSLIFRGTPLGDERARTLRRLAWVWSLENLLLAAAVYNRMFIYVGFNGMTRMRMVGLFGVSAVVVGFLVVIRKIAAERDFVWLIRRELWTLAIAIYLYAVTPVDMIVQGYNVRRILAGDPAPAVQITEHAVDLSGLLMLPPLLECDDPAIRAGVSALLAENLPRVEQDLETAPLTGWTSYQAADHRLAAVLRSYRAALGPHLDNPARRAADWRRFKEYAYQWY